MTVHDAIPERKRLIGQLHHFKNSAIRWGFCFCRVGWRRSDEWLSTTLHQKKSAYRSASLFPRKNSLRRVFTFIGCKNLQAATTLLPDGVSLIRPTNSTLNPPGRIRCDSFAIRHGFELLADKRFLVLWASTQNAASDDFGKRNEKQTFSCLKLHTKKKENVSVNTLL